MRKNDIIATLVLRHLRGVGAAAIKNIWQKGVFQNEPPYNTIERGLQILNKAVTDIEIENLVNEAQEIVYSSGNDDIKLLHIADPYYPSRLSELKDPPSILFYKGNLEKLRHVIGIIGTRDPDTVGLKVAKRISAHFHEKGFSISNGLALGIDEACIKSENGTLQNAVGVLAGGLNYNQSKTLLKTTGLLAEEVLNSGGLLISEFQRNVREDTYKVIKSCRIQAGISQGIILVQSKLDGGSKYTLETFCTLNRPLGIICLADKLNDPLYAANTAIIENFKEGVSQMTGLKQNKLSLDKISIISSKADYDLFENEIRNKLPSHDSTKTLFD